MYVPTLEVLFHGMWAILIRQGKTVYLCASGQFEFCPRKWQVGGSCTYTHTSAFPDLTTSRVFLNSCVRYPKEKSIKVMSFPFG